MTTDAMRNLKMSTGSIIAFAALALGLVGSFGAWERSDGAREATEKAHGERLAIVEASKDQAITKLAVIESELIEARKQIDNQKNDIDQWKAYTYNLTVHIAGHGANNLPAPPQ